MSSRRTQRSRREFHRRISVSCSTHVKRRANSAISRYRSLLNRLCKRWRPYRGLQRHRGHLLNWYDTQTLAPLSPAFVSSVDSGNLVASLWTLQRGCLELLDQPLLQPELPDGFLDHLYVLASLRALPRRKFSAMKRSLKGQDWLPFLLDVPRRDFQGHPSVGLHLEAWRRGRLVPGASERANQSDLSHGATVCSMAAARVCGAQE